MTEKDPFGSTTLDAFPSFVGSSDPEPIMRVIARQLIQEMERQGMAKTILAKKLNTGRVQVDRILKGKGNVTIVTVQRAAALLGRELRLELV